MDPLTALDMDIMHSIHDNMSCGFLDKVMPVITSLGNWGIIWIAAAVILLFFRRTRCCGAAMGGALVGCLVIGNIILKHLVARDRPCWIETEHLMLIAVPSDFSFPSGHTMSSFAAAVVIFHYNKKAGAAALVLAALIAFSRLYLFVHFPTDVIAGLVIGCGIGISAFIAADRIAGRLKRRGQTE